MSNVHVSLVILPFPSFRHLCTLTGESGELVIDNGFIIC